MKNWFALTLVAFVCACGSTRDVGNYQFPGMVSDAGASGGAASTYPEDADVTTPDASVEQPGDHCRPVQGDAIPARLAVISEDAGAPTSTPVFVDDLFNRFNANCGACHVAQGQGHFQVTRSTFPSLANQTMVARMLSDDPAYYMPPPPTGKAGKDRTADDPVMQLATLVRQWIAAGSPYDMFYIQSATDSEFDPDTYLTNAEKGNALTHIGTCVPDKNIVGTARAKMDKIDAAFAALQRKPSGSMVERIGLPEHLDETDLFTLDTEELARHGVIAYAPSYPLWSDNAGKLRMVRVPRGQSITFDSATQAFNIPANTRFYKTFLKRTVDTDGSIRYRKVETRLIVVRPDRQLPDGTLAPAALFGTYVWNDTETRATLLTDPLRDGEPFADRLITLIVDEPAAARARATSSANQSLALRRFNAVRSYAIPGSSRCIDCHRGSPNQSFVLGFTPLQVKRRPTGEGGIIEHASADELGQLQRLIDYGVLSGLRSASDIVGLEDSQGTRHPRNNFELVAQGYMVGNCAHCHNPNGDASVNNPVLTDVLDLMPGPTGGVFQFPLERMSPRISRSPGGTVSMPYVTPSLADYPPEDGGNWFLFWQPKADATHAWPLNVNGQMPASTAAPGYPTAAVFAPWRSLIYRNVDTPFAYSDDFALFPHMPKDVPGFDCRVPRIMAEWMISIPAVRKNTTTFEYAVPVDGTCVSVGQNRCDTEAQPYQEISPSDPRYYQAVSDAAARLDVYHSGSPPWISPVLGPFVNRYDYCPDVSDIVDYDILLGADKKCAPTLVPASGRIWDSANDKLVMPDTNVPLKPHWVNTDLTELPGEWAPRRPDWDTVLVKHEFARISGVDCADEASRQEVEKFAVDKLNNVTLDARLRQYAATEVPFGLWMQKPQCDFSTVQRVSDYSSSTRPQWLAHQTPPPVPSAAVYTQTPGEAVFNMICINCHGADADSRGRMADSLMTMTGGTVRVANLRDGLFGPVGTTGGNRSRVFGPTAQNMGISADDLGARYLAWMGLGGTKAHIPPSILGIVGNTRVLGIPRRAFQSVTAASANMLATAQELCRHVIPWQVGYSSIPFYPENGSMDYEHSALIPTNGDAELWQTICSMNNPAPVRAVAAKDWSAPSPKFEFTPLANTYRQEGYPANTPVGNQHGQVAESLQPNNTFPWCIIAPSDAKQAEVAQTYAQSHAVEGLPLPLCPSSLLTEQNRLRQDPPGVSLGHTDFQDWSTRGAINAGLVVFVYLDQVVAHGYKPKPSYDHCERLK